ncbi:MAG: isocitrate dehydrogenase [Candidatus Omnitrophica bacterium CG11_big_fil_rev_8_21_14_0_20_63_9]|nr:MAG: isocitrate dehydrogenase [Candidatus Omnitrophica bacterium CG11_big_fil_rev_8_21_14_0_20_63_9]
MHKVTFIPGDGIGPEVAWAARRCLDATGVSFHWDERMAGEGAIKEFKTPLPEETLQSVRDNRIAIKGPITTPIGTGFRSVNVALRKQLNLFACVRPCRTYAGVRSPFQNVDLIIVRENTEDLYAGIEFATGEPYTQQLIKELKEHSKQPIAADAAISIKPISKSASERIIRFACEYALSHGRKKVTAIHKANIMKFTDGLFMETARRVGREYDGRLAMEDRLVDATCMQLVLKPQDFDVLVLPNLYGDILSDLCAGLIGGLGVAPGANIGDGIAVFEAVHGSAPKYAGLNKVNPIAMILSGVMMLDYLGEHDAAQRLDGAVAAVLREGRQVTYDLKPERNDPSAVGTKEMAEAIIEKMKTVKVRV